MRVGLLAQEHSLVSPLENAVLRLHHVVFEIALVLLHPSDEQRSGLFGVSVAGTWCGRSGLRVIIWRGLNDIRCDGGWSGFHGSLCSRTYYSRHDCSRNLW